MYNPKQIETKWARIWEENKTFRVDLLNAKKPFYNLLMFPYPSAEGLHVGHIIPYSGGDAYARFQRMNGKDVFEPMGFDAFGIHAENYAIKAGKHPRQLIAETTNYFREKQMKRLGTLFDWSRQVDTTDANYYKWTQWLFIKMFKAGLAVKKKAPLNWCPSCKTVLADEQVEQKTTSSGYGNDARIGDVKGLRNNSEDVTVTPKRNGHRNRNPNRLTNNITGIVTETDKRNLNKENGHRNPNRNRLMNVCERCKSEVEKRPMEQWFFLITKYSERLLNGLKHLNWTEKTKTAQENWIGRKKGVEVRFAVLDDRLRQAATVTKPVSSSGYGNVKDKNTSPLNVTDTGIVTVTAKRNLNKENGHRHLNRNRLTINVFTTRVDTIFGATFVVLAPENPLIKQLPIPKDRIKIIEQYIKKSQNKSEQERLTMEKDKTGVDSGCFAFNPLTNEKIPIWVADYVLMGYGTGAIMAVPAHDSRDFEFAKKYGLEIKTVVKPAQKTAVPAQKPFAGEGVLVNSAEYSGLTTNLARQKITNYLKKHQMGGEKVTYKLRDWCISRQRYWGPPIPMVYCQSCAQAEKTQINTDMRQIDTDTGVGDGAMVGWFPVPEEQLPVKLPETDDYLPDGSGKSPLARIESFVKTRCPNCGGEAEREIDVSDTFLDSSWYFLRYLTATLETAPFAARKFAKRTQINTDGRQQQAERTQINTDGRQINTDTMEWELVRKDAVNRWLPVDMYIGGHEHACLHLLYARFVTMVLHDLGYLDFEEPFKRFYAHGLMIKDGAKMSKSRGNVVNPNIYLDKYGADTLRLYILFLGPFNQGGDFRDSGIAGMYRWLNRVWKLVMASGIVTETDKRNRLTTHLERLRHQTIKKVTEDLSQLKFNTAIAALMEYTNDLSRLGQAATVTMPVSSSGYGNVKDKNTSPLNVTDTGIVTETDKRNLNKENGQRHHNRLTNNITGSVTITAKPNQLANERSPDRVNYQYRQCIKTLLLLLAPMAPFITEELWQRTQMVTDGRQMSTDYQSIHNQSWPEYGPGLVDEPMKEMVIQIDGKTRDKMTVSVEQAMDKVEVEKLTLARERVKRFLAGRRAARTVFVKGRLINLVTKR